MITSARALIAFTMLAMLFSVKAASAPADAAPADAAPADAEPATVCDKAAIQRVTAANRVALKELILKQYIKAATKAESALKLAGTLGCTGHAVTGWAYLIRGAAEHAYGRVRRAFGDWQKALKLNPRIFMPPQVSDRNLHREFNVLKRQIRRHRSGAALRRPRPDSGARCLKDSECAIGNVCYLGRCMHPRDARSRGMATRAPKRTKRGRKAARPRRFTDQGSFELMGGFGFSYVDLEIEDIGVETFTVAFNVYFAYYLIRGFSLGVYAGVPYTESRPKGGTADDTVKSTGFDLAVAPGLTFSLSSHTFLYVNGLIGMAVYNEDSGVVQANGVMGLFGGELGLKLRFGASTLLTLGFRPTYLIGKAKTENPLGSDTKADFNALRLYLILGFSYFGV